MIGNIYARDPNNFIQNNEEVNKVLKNQIAWPKGYIPPSNEIKRIIFKRNLDVEKKEALRARHELWMDPLFDH